MDIDLSAFCSDYENVYDLRKPWSGESNTYASNGHVLIRIPKNGTPENLEYEEKLITGRMGDILGLNNDSLPYIEVKPLLPPAEECSFCKGEGQTITTECPECEGNGEVELGNDFHYYEAECKSCRGNGWVRGGSEKRKCPMCYGSGSESTDRFAGVVIGGAKFNTNLLRLIAKLPDARIFPRGGDPALIVFDGGDGLIMPMHS